MKDLYIVGAGGMGREVVNILLDIREMTGDKWHVCGFLDDTEDPLRGKSCDYGVVGTIIDYFPKPNDVLAMGISDPAAKREVASLLKARGAIFENIIHPWASIGRHNDIGEGNVFYAGFGMTVNCKIGNFCSLLKSGFGHDVQVDDYATVSSNCDVMGRARIGKGVFIGGNVCIGPGITIGDGAYVCLGSSVLKNVAPCSKVMGNPAREIGLMDGKW